MNKFENRYPRRDHYVDEDKVIGEILEDIECLDLVDSDNDNTDLLNTDTFGDFGDTQWDPTETFMEAERLKNVVVHKPRRTSTVLEKFSDFDTVLKTRLENRQFKRENNFRRREFQSRNISPHEETSDPEERVWEDDLLKLKKFGLFEISPEHVDLISSGKKLPDRFKVSQRTMERHIRCVERNERTYDREFFMNSNEFDKILRIQLAQVSKDPKLQTFTGKWNLYHLGVRKPVEDAPEEQEEKEKDGEVKEVEESEKEDKEETKQPKKRPIKFGKTSTASIRHGRNRIYLGRDNANATTLVDLDRDKQIRTTIESCFETLYVLCDVEQEIEKCPMNHVSALDKMQRDRDEYLNDLYTLLTGDVDLFKGILDLNKGRILTAKIGRKLGIENKLLLLCTLVSCLEQFVEICHNADMAFENEASLANFIELATNPHNLKSLVAFESSGSDADNLSDGFRVQNLLFNYNSYTRLFLFVIEGITLTGHLFLLTGKTGRHTALQRCSNVLIAGQQKSKGFEKILNTRSGVVFINIFLQRIRTNSGAVDQNTVDILLHYTLDISEHIESNQQEWNALASNIVKMF